MIIRYLIKKKVLLNKGSSPVSRKFSHISWQKISHTTSCPSLVHLWSTHLFCQSKKTVHKEQQSPAPAVGMLFYASSGLLRFTFVVDFFLWETRLAHYNFCLQKWTYFLVLDTQGIVLRALIQEVSFLSRYKKLT